MLDPRQQQIHEAWCRQSDGGRAVPLRGAFDPIDFPAALSTLALYEFVEDDAVRLRLVGTDITQAWGTDNSGRLLHDFMEGPYHDFIRGHIDQCRDLRAPVFSHSRFQWDLGRAVDTRRLLLPYRRDDAAQDVGFILLSQVFDYGKTGPAEPIATLGTDFAFHEVDRQVLASSAGRGER